MKYEMIFQETAAKIVITRSSQGLGALVMYWVQYKSKEKQNKQKRPKVLESKQKKYSC